MIAATYDAAADHVEGFPLKLYKHLLNAAALSFGRLSKGQVDSQKASTTYEAAIDHLF